jgi:ankyrin repeat protein
MTANSPLAYHLLQAGFRYIETRNLGGLSKVIQEHPEIAQMRDRPDGRGLIHCAAKSGRVDVISAMLDFGADPNMPEGERIADEDTPVFYQPGFVPLHYAVEAGHEKATALLLDRGAVANVADCWGATPLHNARKPLIAQALLKAGADPNAICWMRYFDEESLGWYFAGSPLHTAGQDGAIIRMLVSHGADVNLEADHITKRTALHYAAALGNSAVMQELLDLKADPNALAKIPGYNSSSRMTPLHYAARNGHENAVRILLRAGARADVPGGERGETALALAKAARHRKIAFILAQKSEQ